GLLLVGPDHQARAGAGAAAVRGAAAGGGVSVAGVGAAACGEQGGGGGEAPEGEEALSTDLHVFSFESWSCATGAGPCLVDGTVDRPGLGVQECARTFRRRSGHGDDARGQRGAAGWHGSSTSPAR